MQTEAIYPWLESSLRYLMQLRTLERIPHALLITGPEGLGMETLAHIWIRRLFCNHALLAAGNHPDFLWVKPQEQAVIKIDEIRSIIDYTTHKPNLEHTKIVLISYAEQLHTAAAHALLKVLEEPPQGSQFILVSSYPYRLPATIQSRCHVLRVPLPTEEKNLLWLIQESHCSAEHCQAALSFTHHRPLSALAWLQTNKIAQKNQFLEDLHAVFFGHKNPIEFSDSLVKSSFLEMFDWFYLLILDMLRLGLSDSPRLYHSDKSELVKELQLSMGTAHRLTAYLDKLVEIKRKFQAGIRFNLTLLWDRILIEWIAERKHLNLP